MTQILRKIDVIIDEVQTLMKTNGYLDSKANRLSQLLSKTSIYWDHMNDEDVDYLHCVESVIEQGIKWNVEN